MSRGWPDFGEPQLVERLTSDHDTFLTWLRELFGALGPREFEDAAYHHAIGYPWARPAESYLLRGEEVLPAEGAEPGDDRFPLLAFGSNGAPSRLAAKFAHLPETERDVLVVAGDLHGFDVGFSAHPTIYGAMPATLFPSPGTAVRAAVLWVTHAQLVALTWTEITYRFGRLEGIRFDPDVAGLAPVTDVFAFAARMGIHCPDGEPVACAAIPARGRTAREVEQAELLDEVARHTLGVDGRELVRRVFTDFHGVAVTVGPVLQRTARQFDSPHWVEYPPP